MTDPSDNEIRALLGPLLEDRSRIDYRFKFSYLSVNTSIRSDLFSFPIVEFDSGSPIDPDGSSEHPFHFAINPASSIREQVQAVASMLIGTLRRQAVATDARRSPTDDVSWVDSGQRLDEESRSDGELLSDLLFGGRSADARTLIERWAGVSVEWGGVHRRSGEEISSRVPFFATAYNEIPMVRAAVDRVVSAIAGSEPRIVSSSGEAMEYLASMTRRAGLREFMAHTVRDSELMGVGYLVTDFASGEPRMRLLRPDRARQIETPDGVLVEEKIGDGWRAVDHVAVIPADASRRSGYGPSLLEPNVYALRQYFAFRDVSKQTDTALRRLATTEGQLDYVNRFATATSAGAAETLKSVEKTFEPIFRFLRDPSADLYFKGAEDWQLQD